VDALVTKEAIEKSRSGTVMPRTSSTCHWPKKIQMEFALPPGGPPGVGAVSLKGTKVFKSDCNTNPKAVMTSGLPNLQVTKDEWP